MPNKSKNKNPKVQNHSASAAAFISACLRVWRVITQSPVCQSPIPNPQSAILGLRWARARQARWFPYPRASTSRASHFLSPVYSELSTRYSVLRTPAPCSSLHAMCTYIYIRVSGQISANFPTVCARFGRKPMRDKGLGIWNSGLFHPRYVVGSSPRMPPSVGQGGARARATVRQSGVAIDAPQYVSVPSLSVTSILTACRRFKLRDGNLGLF